MPFHILVVASQYLENIATKQHHILLKLPFELIMYDTIHFPFNNTLNNTARVVKTFVNTNKHISRLKSQLFTTLKFYLLLLFALITFSEDFEKHVPAFLWNTIFFKWWVNFQNTPSTFINIFCCIFAYFPTLISYIFVQGGASKIETHSTTKIKLYYTVVLI